MVTAVISDSVLQRSCGSGEEEVVSSRTHRGDTSSTPIHGYGNEGDLGYLQIVQDGWSAEETLCFGELVVIFRSKPRFTSSLATSFTTYAIR